MKSLFNPPDREAILQRLEALRADSPRQWGKMDPAQALAHCAVSLETPAGLRPEKQKLLGKLLSPLVRKSVLGEKPFSQGSPTDPSYVASDSRDFEAERTRLRALMARMAERDPATAAETHPFFGLLSGDEWGRLMYKHLDHHLRQFNA